MVTQIFCSGEMLKYPNMVKKIAAFGVTASFILGIFISLVFICLKYPLAEIFVDSSQSDTDLLQFYILLYGCISAFHILLPQLRMICIVTGNKKILIFCQVANNLFITSVINMTSYQFADIGKCFIMYSRMYAYAMSVFIQVVY